jgi:hypothetical protein
MMGVKSQGPNMFCTPEKMLEDITYSVRLCGTTNYSL